MVLATHILTTNTNESFLTMTTFQERFKQALGERGYEKCMRRSIQTVFLYEAFRCIQSNLPQLRPFQRKLAFFDQVKALLKQSPLLPHQREEVLWRTGTSKEPLEADLAWKRMKMITPNLQDLSEKMKPHFVEGLSHDDLITVFIQGQYILTTGEEVGKKPTNWEHSHNHLIMAYKMYYDCLSLDPTFPEAQLATEIVVPHEKPTKSGESTPGATAGHVRQGIFTNASSPRASAKPPPRAALLNRRPAATATEIESSEERRAIMQEVKEHMDLLKQFEDIVPREDMAKRKRLLYDALPSPPPTAVERKRMRQQSL